MILTNSFLILNLFSSFFAGQPYLSFQHWTIQPVAIKNYMITPYGDLLFTIKNNTDYNIILRYIIFEDKNYTINKMIPSIELYTVHLKRKPEQNLLNFDYDKIHYTKLTLNYNIIRKSNVDDKIYIDTNNNISGDFFYMYVGGEKTKDINEWDSSSTLIGIKDIDYNRRSFNITVVNNSNKFYPNIRLSFNKAFNVYIYNLKPHEIKTVKAYFLQYICDKEFGFNVYTYLNSNELVNEPHNFVHGFCKGD